jgi:hypothetical protein
MRCDRLDLLPITQNLVSWIVCWCFQEKYLYMWKLCLIEIVPHCDQECTACGTVLIDNFYTFKCFSRIQLWFSYNFDTTFPGLILPIFDKNTLFKKQLLFLNVWTKTMKNDRNCTTSPYINSPKYLAPHTSETTGLRHILYCGIFAQNKNCGARETAVDIGRLWN